MAHFPPTRSGSSAVDWAVSRTPDGACARKKEEQLPARRGEHEEQNNSRDGTALVRRGRPDAPDCDARSGGMGGSRAWAAVPRSWRGEARGAGCLAGAFSAAKW